MDDVADSILTEFNGWLAGLLEGEGKHMRHVKLCPGKKLNDKALGDLIAAAYHDIRQRLDLV